MKSQLQCCRRLGMQGGAIVGARPATAAEGAVLQESDAEEPFGGRGLDDCLLAE